MDGVDAGRWRVWVYRLDLRGGGSRLSTYASRPSRLGVPRPVRRLALADAAAARRGLLFTPSLSNPRIFLFRQLLLDAGCSDDWSAASGGPL